MGLVPQAAGTDGAVDHVGAHAQAMRGGGSGGQRSPHLSRIRVGGDMSINMKEGRNTALRGLEGPCRGLKTPHTVYTELRRICHNLARTHPRWGRPPRNPREPDLAAQTCGLQRHSAPRTTAMPASLAKSRRQPTIPDVRGFRIPLFRYWPRSAVAWLRNCNASGIQQTRRRVRDVHAARGLEGRPEAADPANAAHSAAVRRRSGHRKVHGQAGPGRRRPVRVCAGPRHPAPTNDIAERGLREIAVHGKMRGAIRAAETMGRTGRLSACVTTWEPQARTTTKISQVRLARPDRLAACESRIGCGTAPF